MKLDLGKEVDLLETKNLIAYSFALEAEKSIIKKWGEDEENEINEE